MDGKSLRVLRVGLFDRNYPRNRTTAAALRAAGAEITDLHAPVLESIRDRLRPARATRALAQLGQRIVAGEAGLVVRAAPALAKTDIVLIGYPGQWDAVFWSPLARRAGCTVVFDPLVTLTETFVEDRALLAPGSWQARILRWLDQRAFRAADVVLADTPQQAAYWAALAGIPLDRLLILPVGADEELFTAPVTSQAPREEPDCLRVLFYGTYSPLHGAETIVAALHRLERASERVALVMIGTGQCEAVVRQRAAKLGLEGVTFIQWVPEEELPRWIAWADVVLGIFGSTAKAARVVPNKVYQAMAMGAAIVTRDSPALRWLAGGEPCAVLVSPGDADALAAALRSLRDPSRRLQLGETARRVFERVASTPARAQALQPLLERVERRWRNLGRRIR